MRQVIAPVARSLLLSRFSRAGFHHSAPLAGSEWIKLRDEEYARQTEKWKKKRSDNPFIRNVGAAQQLRALNVDPEDPLLEEAFSRSQVKMDPEAFFADLYDKSGQLEREVNPRGRREPALSKEALARILHKKRFFPDPKEPSLLTWMERQMMIHLHEKDPIQWSAAALSEAFPATENTVKKVLRNRRSRTSPAMIAASDERVRNNWKLLAVGELEISDELRKHVLEHGDEFESRVSRFEMVGAQEDIVKQYLKNQEPNLGLKTGGKFSNIIASYRKKVEVKLAFESSNSQQALQTLQTPKAAFSPETEWDPASRSPSAWRETALLNMKIDRSKARYMTAETFKKIYLERGELNSDQACDSGAAASSHVAANRKILRDWLRMERLKDARVSKPRTLREEDVQTSKTTDDIFRISKYKRK